MKKSHFVIILIIIFIIFTSGCTTTKKVTERPNITPTLNVSPTSTPYAAPTIEKITQSRYVKSPDTPIPTITDNQKYREPDPIVGTWEITNTTPVTSVIFSPSGSGSVRYFSDAHGFVWGRGETKEGNITYTIRFYDSSQYNIVVNYDTSNDRGTTSITEENQFLVRK
jgi:hypothetical protein